jgi:hypothetical protein
MQFDQKQLFGIARDYPWFLFTGEQISELCNVGEDQVRRVRNAPDSPFRYNKCRPEWFTEWMQNHPEFQQPQASPPVNLPHCERCAEAVRERLQKKPLRAKKNAGTRRASKRHLTKET